MTGRFLPGIGTITLSVLSELEEIAPESDKLHEIIVKAEAEDAEFCRRFGEQAPAEKASELVAAQTETQSEPSTT